MKGWVLMVVAIFVLKEMPHKRAVLGNHFAWNVELKEFLCAKSDDIGVTLENP